eukprot:CAMPEP_0176424656 /NCGR_PEP_ID=MMETSP0127-20121128/10953_1 /TAXON_ID=938130 /ORGANISM="Platyophrya macrostoma, Strain WH" /LENGTH=122 /DNA_ID=CAMNT_0017805727 /DNA_START=43 /DNA_END=411 /DNA_ORIENTATION=+
MFRRFAPVVARTQTNAVAKRTFFYSGGGEAGIWAATGYRMFVITWGLIIVCAAGIYRTVFCRYSTKRQFVGDSTDLWNSDGTVMEGAEAVANLRIQHERIMPFMNAIQEKVEAAGGEAAADE